MLIGLSLLIRLHNVVPRGNVTLLAQLSAAAFGTGWPFYLTNLTVTLVLAFAANTSFGGLPVLLSLLAKDHRLPHLFALRAERPVFRYGVSALAILSGLLLIALGADTHRLLPLFAIGVFIGFTISQVGMVQHWRTHRGPGWVGRATLNGVGAVLTAGAAVIFMASKFTEGAWQLLIVIPALMLLFARIERYYRLTGEELGLGRIPPRPQPVPAANALVVIPVVAVNKLTERALAAGMRMGGKIVPVAVDLDPDATPRLCEQWETWDPGVELKVLPSPHRTLVAPIVGYVRHQIEHGNQVTVLLSEVEPTRRRYQVLHNQRGLILAAALRARTDAIVAILAFRLRAR